MQKMLILPILFCVLACQKEAQQQPTSPAPSNPEPKAKILWQYPIHPDTLRYITQPQILLQGNPLYATNLIYPSASLTSFTPQGGAPQWVFNGFIESETSIFDFQICQINNQVFVANFDYVHAIDANTGTLDWYEQVADPTAGSDVRLSAFGDYVYSRRWTGTVPTQNSNTLVRIHRATGRVDSLFTVPVGGDGYYDNIFPPAFWINPQGDTILIWRNSEPYITGGDPPIPPGLHHTESHLNAWNLRTRQPEWEIKHFAVHGISAPKMATIDDNYAYVIGQGEVYCIDLLAGQVKWMRQLTHILSYALMIYEDKVIVKANGEGMWALDKTTGDVKWYNSKADGQANRFDYCDDVIYYTGQGTGMLYAINANTGATLWSEFTPNRGAKHESNTWGDGNAIIDRERKILYTADRYYFIAIDLSK
jgi:outer membrane protein assembly factor BamB